MSGTSLDAQIRTETGSDAATAPDPTVITSDRFPVEPWQLREVSLDLGRLAQSESIFALSNGHIGVRGNLDEGEPSGLPGTYLNSFYEGRPLPYAESGYGYPESGQTIVNVTNGKLIRLFVDDEPFDLRYGRIIGHQRVLDFRAGTLRRIVEWSSPNGQVVRITSTRLVSFTQRAILAVRYEVEVVSSPGRVVVQSELVANEPLPGRSTDPRAAAALERPLHEEERTSDGNRSCLIHRTRQSGVRMVAAVDHVIVGNDGTTSHTYLQEDLARTTIGSRLQVGQRLSVTKFVSYGWSEQRSLPALRDQADAALSSALDTGWDALAAEQRAYLEEFWDGADVQLDGDPAVQQAVRFGLFHVLQAGARAEERAIPAKGLTGPGYDGHAFWDTEAYVLPVLTATAPEAAADALRWRRSTLPLAHDRARTLKLEGAAFPWRTIRGQECSAYWPAGTAAFHVNADIAVAAARHVDWTGDDGFERTEALPLLTATARLWMSLGHLGDDGAFHIDGVTGPDEYSALVDDNTYTNLMAARNLRYAVRTARRQPDGAAEAGVGDDEIAQWEHAAHVMAVPWDRNHQIYEQDRGSTLHQRWNFEETAENEGYPLLLHAPYFDLYRKQVVKQADLVLAMHWCGDYFTVDEKAAAFAYYEELTVRDSSLSACSQAVIAAEVGHLDLAYDYLSEAAFIDLDDREHNTGDGVHVASLAGAWIALVCGFGGLRDYDGQLRFAPRLPRHLRRLSFTVRWRSSKIRVVTAGDHVRYSLEDPVNTEMTLLHHGETFTLTRRNPVELDVPPLKAPTDSPRQPAGRIPVRANPL